MKRFAMLLAAGAVATALGCAEDTATTAPETESSAATTTTETPASETSATEEPAGTDSDVRLVSLSVPNMV